MVIALNGSYELELSNEPRLSQWVNSAWNIPTYVDAATQAHRLKAQNRFSNFFNFAMRHSAHKINLNNFVATRMGSDFGLATENSDQDLLMFSTDSRMTYELYEMHQWNKFFRSEFGVDMVGVQTTSNFESLFGFGLATPLLVTPDELLLGNKEIAQEARLEIIAQLDSMPPKLRDSYWGGDHEFSFKNFFWNFYLYWPFYRDQYYAEAGRQPNFSKRKLFVDRLQREATQCENPYEHADFFWESLVKLQLPDYYRYRDGIKASKGKLEML